MKALLLTFSYSIRIFILNVKQSRESDNEYVDTHTHSITTVVVMKSADYWLLLEVVKPLDNTLTN